MPIDFTKWSDRELEIGLRAGRRAGERRSPSLPDLIAEMERRGLGTKDDPHGPGGLLEWDETWGFVHPDMQPPEE